MISTIDQGFKIVTGNDGVNGFLFDSSRPIQSVDFARKNSYKRLVLNPFHGYTAQNINDILPLKDFIEELVIGDEKISYNGLFEFSKLKMLGIPDNGKDIIELSNFPNLETLACDYSPRLCGLDKCNKLQKLVLTSYKPKTKDITDLSTLNSLVELELIKTDILSLVGIERYLNLKKIEIYSASKLESLSNLLELKLLEELIIQKCKSIKDYEILINAISLKKLILSESGTIKSLFFLSFLKNLEFISFWGTNVLDGNLSYCEGISFVGFDNKRHYSHKLECFKKQSK